jgi:CHAT domain-containing protein/tetratricopeptide (TPR) repeat protein
VNVVRPVVLLIAVAAAAAGETSPRARILALLAQADVSSGEWDYTAAEERASEARRLAASLTDRALEARAAALLANASDGRGDFEPGTTRRAEALAIARGVGDPGLESGIVADSCLSHWRRAEYDAALLDCRQALAAFERAGDDRGRARTLDLVGRVHFKKGEYGVALESYGAALAIAEGTGDLSLQADVLGDVASLHLDRGEYTDALGAWDRALDLRVRTADVPGQVWILKEIGVAWMFQGALGKAEDRFARALDVATTRAGRSLALWHLGAVSIRRGKYDRALELLDEARVMRGAMGDRRSEAVILTSIAKAHAGLGDDARALEYLELALDLRERIRDERQLAGTLHAIASLYERTGDLDRAIEWYEKELALAERIEVPYVSQALSGLGRIRARRGEADAALSLGRRAVEHADRIGNPRLAIEATHSLGVIEGRLHRNEDALRSLRRSLDLIERARAEVPPGDEPKMGFLDGLQGVYSDTISLLFDAGRSEEALEVAERARARAFLDLLGARDAERPVSVPPPTLAALKGEARSRRATILEFHASETRLFLWVLRPDGAIHAVAARTERREIARLAASLRSPGTAPVAGRRLYDLLIAPVEARLPPDPEALVIVVPHGPLFLVSFAGLPDRRGVPFVTRHTLAYAPALSVLRYTESRRRSAADSRRVLVVGNPEMPRIPGRASPLPALPGAEAEARRIGDLYAPERRTVLLGPAATERAVRELAPGRGVLHFATHGILADDEPLESLLALAADEPRGDGSRDGLLTAREVLDLDLATDLVVLSGCDTGLGRINGDGVVGMSRAFVYAGAPSVVVSLWRVADAVAGFEMERFHLERTRGRTKAEALRLAQLATLASLEDGSLRSPAGKALSPDPVYWASFVLMGEAD